MEDSHLFCHVFSVVFVEGFASVSLGMYMRDFTVPTFPFEKNIANLCAYMGTLLYYPPG